MATERLRYAETWIAAVLGFRPPSDRIEPALLDRVFRELSRTPEVETPVRDLWGNWDFPYGESHLRGELYTPWLDQPIVELRRTLLEERPDRAIEPLWPEARPFAVCLTHDVDVITLNPSLRGSARTVARELGLALRDPRDTVTVASAMRTTTRAAWHLATLRMARPKPERTYDEWLKLEDRHGFKSTFLFFPTRVAAPHVYDCSYAFDDPAIFDGRRMRVRDLMNEIANAGWEVGLHGSYHSALRPGLLADQKAQVEAVIGRPIASTRQHWLHYDVRVTPGLQAAAGLQADSTQGFNRTAGFRAGTAFPYRCWDFDRARPSSVLEVPQHVMDGALFTPNAMEYDVEHAVKHCLHLMDEVQRVGGCLTLSWHPNAIHYPSYWEVYEAVLAEAARRRAWGCTMGELRAWWTDRSRRIDDAR